MVRVTVTAVNDPPEPVDDQATTNEDPVQPLTLTAVDLIQQPPNDQPGGADDELGQTLSLISVSPVSTQGGTVELNGTIVTYTPPANFNRINPITKAADVMDTFTYRVRDNGLTNNQPDPRDAVGTVTVTVIETNDAPVITAPNAASIDEDTPKAILGLAVSDLDVEESNDPRLEIALRVDHGALTVNGVTGLGVSYLDPVARDRVTLNGTLAQINDTFVAPDGLIYEPAENYNGNDLLQILVNDLNHTPSPAETASHNVPLTIAAVNDPPVVTPTNAQPPTAEDTAAFLTTVTISDADIEAGDEATTVFQVTLTAQNGVLSVATDITGGLIDNQVTNNDTDNVTLDGTLAAIQATLGAITGVIYQPNLDYNDYTTDPPGDSDPGDPDEVIVVTVSDLGSTGKPGAEKSAASITVSVTPVNDPPVANDDTGFVVDEDSVLVAAGVGVLDNDTEVDFDETTGERQLISVARFDTTSQLGVPVMVDPDGTFTYLTTGLPLVRTTQDGGSGLNERQIVTLPIGAEGGTFTLTVNNETTMGIAFNAAPSAVKTALEALDSVGVDDVNVTDGCWIVEFVGGSLAGTNVEEMVFDGSGLTIGQTIQELEGGESLTDTFTYTATDGLETSNEATVTVTVTGLNDVPTAVDDQYVVNDNVLLDTPRSVLANDSDPEGDPLQVIVSESDTISNLGAKVTVQPNGNFVYDPTSSPALAALKPDEVLIDTFTYTVDDDDAGNDSTSKATVSITVNGANTAPKAAPDTYSTVEDEPLRVDAPGVLVNDSDVDSTQLSVIPQAFFTPIGASVVIRSDGGFDYDPTTSLTLAALNGSESMNDQFVYVATDAGAAIASGTVTITVNGITDPPRQNQVQYTDVNGDGNTTPIDALNLINYVNAFGFGPAPDGPGPGYYDVNGDNAVTPADVLDVINRLNNPPATPVGGEGESLAAAAPLQSVPEADSHGPLLVSAGTSRMQTQPMGSSALVIGVAEGDSPVQPARYGAFDVPRSHAATQKKSVFDDLAVGHFDLEDTLTDIAEELHGLEDGENATDEVMGRLFA